MSRPSRHPVLAGVLGLALAAALAVLAFNADNLPIIGGGTTYTADFTEAAGLRTGNEVRVAGVKVGTVTRVALHGGVVRVGFRVKDTWVGDTSTVAIRIKTLLGDKVLALDPLGGASQNPRTTIPVSRTTSPFDVTEAFGQLSDTVSQIDTDALARSFDTMAQTFRNTPDSVKGALRGLSDLSRTISSRDTQLAQLLTATKQITGRLADDNAQFQALLADGNLLLAEVQRRRDAIGALLTGTQQLAVQISGLVADNTATLGPTLAALDRVTDVLQRNQDNLTRALALAGPYYRMVGNAIGNGRWFDAYLCGLVPDSYLPAGTAPSSGCVPPRTGSTR
ncbi:MCE family protein [Actinoplanes auranticolor]|uniref:ABC transporter substrate-binding protein n=1 Tax=Actinoplanes auranticolor TaxID=47988 RepID=A0A919VQ44_9ACTN|nr:MCE family protein [Actinoplanes auranticolor]GIM71787.1 ABC transporter substrate-binding protein [Actinoplanes auranticolor]